MQFNKEKYKVSHVGIIPSWKSTTEGTTDYASDLQRVTSHRHTESQKHCTTYAGPFYIGNVNLFELLQFSLNTCHGKAACLGRVLREF